MNIGDLYFTERSSFDRPDLFDVLWLCVNGVSIVLLPENLELFKDVLDVDRGNGRTMGYLLNRKLLV